MSFTVNLEANATIVIEGQTDIQLLWHALDYALNAAPGGTFTTPQHDALNAIRQQLAQLFD
jgi:hypothetical protein